MGISMNNLLSLDPAGATGNGVVEIAANLYDFLIELHPEDTTRIEPGLAQRWEVGADGRSLVFHLREGARFQSGAPVMDAPHLAGAPIALEPEVDIEFLDAAADA